MSCWIIDLDHWSSTVAFRPSVCLPSMLTSRVSTQLCCTPGVRVRNMAASSTTPDTTYVSFNDHVLLRREQSSSTPKKRNEKKRSIDRWKGGIEKTGQSKPVSFLVTVHNNKYYHHYHIALDPGLLCTNYSTNKYISYPAPLASDQTEC